MERQATLMVERDDRTVKEYEVLDLRDIALLLTYEYYARQPRFRHATLVDVAHGDEELELSSIATLPREWNDPAKRDGRVGLAYQVDDDVQHERDTPENMLPATGVPPRLQALSSRELETIFWRARAQDACGPFLTLLRYLFALYDADQPVRIRLDAGHEFVTRLRNRLTATYTLEGPKQMVLCVVSRGPKEHATYLSGGGSESTQHRVVGFLPIPTPDLARPGQKSAMLDLASMRFCDSGRKRTAPFVLEEIDVFSRRMNALADNVTGPEIGGAHRGAEEPAPSEQDLQEEGEWLASVERKVAGEKPREEDMWLADVAQRVKERYDRRDMEHWCGYCGAPVLSLACTGCKAEWYCHREHQVAAWPHHKHWCEGREK